MVVYVEYAFLQNFLLDFTLLYLAVFTARGRIGWGRVTFSALVGAGEAIAFPLLPLPTLAACAVKLSGGLLLVLLAVKRGSLKTYCFASLAFFGYTFLLGGVLTAIYSFADISYAEGGGYLVESAPVGLVLGAAGVLLIVAISLVKTLVKKRAISRSIMPCTLFFGEKSIVVNGLVDSGNLLYFRGEAVSVLSPTAGLALGLNERALAGRMTVTTVHGSEEKPLFRLGKAIVNGKEKTGALFTLSQTQMKDCQAIIHSDWVEVNRGDFIKAKKFSKTEKAE